MKVLLTLLMASLGINFAYASGKTTMHYISTICSDSSQPNKGFKWGYMTFTSPEAGEIHFNWSSYDDQYSCEATATVRFEELFIHPNEVSCQYANYEIDLPEMKKIGEKTVSTNPILKEYTYEATLQNSRGYCDNNSKLILHLEPLDP